MKTEKELLKEELAKEIEIFKGHWKAHPQNVILAIIIVFFPIIMVLLKLLGAK